MTTPNDMTPPNDNTSPSTPLADPNDPVLARREQWRRGAALGKRVGYGAYLLAIVAFIIAAIVGFSDTWSTIVLGALVVGSLALLPAIIAGYAVGAAERDDLGLPDGH